MFFIVLIAYFIIFYGFVVIGQRLCTRVKSISNLGERIHNKKIQQFESSAFFAPLRKAVRKQSKTKALSFIFPLILLKSIAFLAFSLVLISPLIIIFQGIAMGSLFNYEKHHDNNFKALQTITFWQLSSHLIAATLGTLIGLNWLVYKTSAFSIDLLLVKENIIYYIFIGITALIAAYFEARLLIEESEFL